MSMKYYCNIPIGLSCSAERDGFCTSRRDVCEYRGREKERRKDYYEIAKRAYCTPFEYSDCRDCDMCDYFEQHDYSPADCREKLIRELVHIIDELKKGEMK